MPINMKASHDGFISNADPAVGEGVVQGKSSLWATTDGISIKVLKSNVNIWFLNAIGSSFVSELTDILARTPYPLNNNSGRKGKEEEYQFGEKKKVEPLVLVLSSNSNFSSQWL
jgi:hypothetical protein